MNTTVKYFLVAFAVMIPSLILLSWAGAPGVAPGLISGALGAVAGLWATWGDD